jgi:BlaI family transcriptional regulator, penicillinase repressor
MTQPRPTELELQILSVLWSHGPATVHEIRGLLPDGKARAYTTVLTLVQIMEKKGFLAHVVEGNAHRYRPVVERRRILRPMMRDLLRNVFQGNPAQAIQCLLDGSRLDPDELAEVREVLRNAGIGD